MKYITTAAQRIWADKYLTTILAIFFAVSIFTMVVLALNIHPNDLQVTTRFSSLGLQHIYKDDWFFQWSFVLFLLFVMLAHTAIVIKLTLLKKRRAAIAVVFASIALAFVALLMLSSVFHWNL